MGAKQTEAGKTRIALAKALGEAGYDVDPQHIRQVYSTRSYRPLARWQWEVVARRRLDGAMVTIRSWDTMGACVHLRREMELGLDIDPPYQRAHVWKAAP